MANVTLVNPNLMKPAVAPIALDYLAESLAADGHQVEVLDLSFSPDWRADVDAHFSTRRPDLIGFTIRNTDDCYFASRDFFIPTYKEMIALIRLNADSPIVLGGAGLSVAAQAVMAETGADYAVVGEGELALSMLASAAEKHQDVSGIPGLVFRTASGFGSNPQSLIDLSNLPLRTRRWLDNRRYFEEGGQGGVETKRGCDRRCIYCADPLGKGRICRVCPPSHIVAEVRALVDQGVDCIHICDSEFNIPVCHAEAVCREILNSDLVGSFTWYTYASPAPFTEGLADLMQRAGCVGIDFGADSSNDDILRSLGRDFTGDDVRRTAAICRKQGITFMYDLLIGGPGETRESIKRTIETMKEIGPDRVGVSVGVRIYDGTALADKVRREGFSRSNPDLHGQIEDNDYFLRPVYYMSPDVGADVFSYVSELIGGDQRFLHASPDQIEGNYNYNDNSVLVQAIRQGCRGAYWDILRRIQEKHA